MKLTNRQRKIINAVVKEYVKSAHPVSSKLLKKKYKFEVSPATLRNEMKELTDKGYLFQPHTSAGRVPADKSYRFFVNHFLEKEFQNKKREQPKKKEDVFEMSQEFEKEVKDIHKFVRTLTKKLAHFSSSLAICYLLEEEIMLREGWNEIFKEPEFKNSDFSSQFIDMVDILEKSFEDLPFENGRYDRIKIYIGKEVPFSKKSEFSVIVSRCSFSKIQEGFLTLLGPKRMAYPKNISLMNSVIKLLEEKTE